MPYPLKGIDELPPKITSLIRQAVNVPEIARKALSYVTFILGGILLAGAAIYMVLNQRRPKAVENGNGMNGHSKKVCIHKVCDVLKFDYHKRN